VRLDPLADKFRGVLAQSFVRLHECRGEMAIDVQLPYNLSCSENWNNYFGLGLD
jgi:hypothetical protein